MRHRQLAIVGAIATCAFPTIASSPAAAEDPVIGPPIAAPPHPLIRPEPHTLRISASAPDPEGGPQWAVGTYFATGTGAAPYGDRRLLCVTGGRLVNGQLGAMTDTGAFRPFSQIYGMGLQCVAAAQPGGERAFGYASLAVPERIANDCFVTIRPGTPACLQGERTIIAVSLGRGILGGQARDGQHWRPLRTGADGSLLAVYAGTFTDATIPAIRVTATACGPNARTDIRAWELVRRGCQLTFELPNGPRPAPETAASRNARHARRLDLPVRIVERRGVASIRRFSVRVRLPITIRSANEGYAYRLSGPAGPGCRSRRTADASSDYLSSYLMVASKPYSLPLLPLDVHRGVWCDGTYRLQVVFVRRNSAARIVRKVVATAMFSVRNAERTEGKRVRSE